MIIQTITATFESEIEKVWNTVTDNRNYSWRSDLKYVKIIDEDNFTEIHKNGFEVDFKITSRIPYKQYAFEVDSKNSYGEWLGLFSRHGNGTKVTFTEKIRPKNAIKKFFIKIFLQKQQEKYLKDLKKHLGE